MKKLSLLLLLTLGACFSGSPAPERYTLEDGHAIPQDMQTSRRFGVVQVLLPKTQAGLDSERIAVERGNGQVDVVENAVWAERLDTMVQSLLIRALRQSGAYRKVVDSEDVTPASLTLRTTIERFTLVYTPQPHVEVTLDAELLGTSGKTLRARQLSASVPLATVRMRTVIPAFEQAFSECLEQWTKR